MNVSSSSRTFQFVKIQVQFSLRNSKGVLARPFWEGSPFQAYPKPDASTFNKLERLGKRCPMSEGGGAISCWKLHFLHASKAQGAGRVAILHQKGIIVDPCAPKKMWEKGSGPGRVQASFQGYLGPYLGRSARILARFMTKTCRSLTSSTFHLIHLKRVLLTGRAPKQDTIWCSDSWVVHNVDVPKMTNKHESHIRRFIPEIPRLQYNVHPFQICAQNLGLLK